MSGKQLKSVRPNTITRGCVLAACVVLAAAPHRAVHADVLVLDACVRPCDDEDLRLIGLVRSVLERELGRPGLVADPRDAAKHLGHGAPLPAITDATVTADKLTKDLKQGIELWTSAPLQPGAAPPPAYEKADRMLEAALSRVKENPGIVVSDPTLRQLIPRAYVVRATIFSRLGRAVKSEELRRKLDDQAKNAIADLVRTTPEPSIGETWGSEPDKVFQQSRADLVARGRGSLLIRVDDPSVIFYINAQGQPHETMFAADVLPGRYDVLARDSRDRSRRYEIEVRPNAQTTLDIRWSRDTDFEVVPPTEAQQPRIGFTYATDGERTKEPEYVRHVGGLAHSTLMIVVGTVLWRGQPAMIGTVYRTSTGSIVRVGIAPAAGGLDHARELATYLLSPTKPTPHVIKLASPPWVTPWPRPPAPPAESRIGLVHAIGWSASLGSLAGGGTLLLSERDASETRVAYLAIGTGFVVGAATTIAFLLQSRPRRSPPVAVVPTSSGLLVSVGGKF
jgi:hypothetical protein